MPDIAQLERALVNADKAGDADAARVLASEIKKLRQPPVSVEKTPVDPTAGGSTLQVFNPFGNNLDTGISLGQGTNRFLAGAGKALANVPTGVTQLGLDAVSGISKVPGFQFLPSTDKATTVLQGKIDEEKKLTQPLMDTGAGFAGNVVGNAAAALPFAFVPGANSYLGATAIGGGLGATQPVATGESRAMNAAMGGVFGAAGQGVGQLAGKAVRGAAKKVMNIERTVAERAAKEAADETLSARSAAGTAAQDAYRQLEHLRELGAMRQLTPDEAMVAAQLERELADKTIEKLMPAAARKESTSLAYKDAIATESKRASERAAQLLSGNEAKSQFMARVKRYGPAALGGLIGNAVFPGVGGAISGIAGGLYLRPALRSMVNLSKNPAVQHRVLSPIANAGLLNNPGVPPAFGLIGSSIYAAQ